RGAVVRRRGVRPGAFAARLPLRRRPARVGSRDGAGDATVRGGLRLRLGHDRWDDHDRCLLGRGERGRGARSIGGRAVRRQARPAGGAVARRRAARRRRPVDHCLVRLPRLRRALVDVPGGSRPGRRPRGVARKRCARRGPGDVPPQRRLSRRRVRADGGPPVRGRTRVMEQRLSLITLGGRDLARARGFYEALGWKSNAAPADDVVFFQAGGMIVALWGRGQLAEDSGVEDSGGWGGITLAYNTRSPDEVDAVLEEVAAA